MGWKSYDKYEGKEMKIKKISDNEQEKAKKELAKFHGKVLIGDFKEKHFANPIMHHQAIKCSLNNVIPYSINTNMALVEEKNEENILECNKNNNENKNFKWDASRKRLVIANDDELCDVANFRIKIKELITEIYTDHERKEAVSLIVFYRNQCFSLQVLVEKFFELNKEIIKKYPQCIVYNIKLFSNYAAEMFGDARHLEHKTIYSFSGWYRENESLVYLNSSMLNVKSDVVMEFNGVKANKFLENFMETSSEKNKLIIILLYSLWTYFSIFYEEARIDGCRSVLYLAAPTNTGKTSLAKILSIALLNEKAKSVMRFDDTIASLEESLFKARDLLSLIDDFYAKGNKVEEQDFKAKASTITRIVGDSMIKGKMGANRKPMPDRHYRGGVIATGEYIDLNTHSSYLRCWVLHFPENSINFNKNLTLLQESPDLARSFYSLWIKWLEKNQNNINNELKEIHQKNLELARQKYKIAYPRLISNIATFFTIKYFWEKFSAQYNFQFDKDKVHNAIIEESNLQLKLLDTMSPTEIVLKALNEALDNAYIKIADNEADFKGKDFDGYYDEKCIVIITSRFENVVEKYVNKNSYGLKFNNALKDGLVSKNILLKEGDACNIKYTKAREIEPKRPRIYKINRGVL